MFALWLWEIRLKRFVILHHAVGPQLERTDEPHLDWMFEVDGRLKTFATAVVPGLVELMDEMSSPRQVPASFEIEAQPLAAHRLEYLTYEGEIPGGRGRVRRVIDGRFQCEVESEDRFLVRLFCRSLNSVDGEELGKASEPIQAKADFYLNRPVGPRLSVSREEWRLRWTRC